MPSKASKATATIDHEEIKRWADERGATPACVRGTGEKGDVGMIRLDFPGYTGEQSLQPIEWDEWFEKFEQQGLALLHQETTASGEPSNFNKLVSREHVAIPKRKSAGASAKASSTEKSAAQSKAAARNVRRSAEGKKAQKRNPVVNISRRREAAKPSPHTRPTRDRAA
jgi:hypothetical protein